MASRVSSVSSISSLSSIRRQTVEPEELLRTPAATISTSEDKQPIGDQRAAADHTKERVTTEPLLQPKDSGHHEEQTADSDGPVEMHSTHYERRSWYHDWWFWEISGALLSLGSTVGIVVMLAVYNHRPVPVLRYGITLNAMLSVLSTIAKVSLKIDAMLTFAPFSIVIALI